MKDEIWKDVKGYEGNYQVSNIGRVKSLGWDYIRSQGRRSIKANVILNSSISRTGYQRIELNRVGKPKKFVVHRLVAMAFIPNPENKEEVNHKDGNKLNNHVSNLEWNTSKENIRHAFKNKLTNVAKGENHVRAKLTKEQVVEIINKFHSGEYTNQTKVGELYNVDRRTIGMIVSGKNWRHISRIKS